MAMRVSNELRVQYPNAAGIDIGGSSHFVAVPADRSEMAVREFGCYTQDLQNMAAWLLHYHRRPGINGCVLDSCV
jgi:hypothetical protein